VYCHKCGTKAEEKYCIKCGTKIVSSDATIIESWRSSSNFKEIAKHPEVLNLIEKQSKKSNSKITHENLINTFDLVFGTITGVPIGFLMEVLVPITRRLGLKTGKSLTVEYPESIQEIFVKSLCSMYKNQYTLEEFHEANDGVILIGKIKANMQTFGGNLIITLKRDDEKVIANFQAVIKGQLIDWGKSKSVLKTIKNEIENINLNN